MKPTAIAAVFAVVIVSLAYGQALAVGSGKVAEIRLSQHADLKGKMLEWNEALTIGNTGKNWNCGYPFFYAFGLTGGPSSDPPPVPAAFELKRTGAHCKVYVDSGASPYPSASTLDNVVNEFDGTIWVKDTTTFGDPGLAYTEIMIETMDGPSGVGGYYSGGDQIYVDCADLGSWGFEIVAHEFQHLIHGKINGGGVLWMNEACSMYAIYKCYPSSSTLPGYVDAHEVKPNADLTVFSNSMNDYGSCYVWLRYFAEHFGGDSTVKKYVKGPTMGISGINLCLVPYSTTFEKAFPDFALANYILEESIDTGEFGYNGLTMSMNAAGSHGVPWSGSGSVTSWGSEYHIVSTSMPKDLKIDFTGGASKAIGIIGAVGTGGHSSQVWRMTLDGAGKSTVYIMGAGSNYSDIILTAAGLSNGGSYSWAVAEYSGSSNSPPGKPAAVTGPTSGDIGLTYNYTSIAADPDGDQMFYTFDWGDGTTSDTIFGPSGTTVGQKHAWSARGTFDIRVKATDSRGGVSIWGDTVAMNIKNLPPNTLAAPSGPSSTIVGQSATYLVSATDPESDMLKVTFDWGDGVTNTTSLDVSGASFSASHVWSATGTFQVKAMAEDALGAKSAWGSAVSVTVNPNNTAPNSPAAISGPSVGDVGTSYTFSTVITDPDADQVYCVFDWGDGTNTTTALQASGTTASAQHAWTTAANYSITARAVDSKNALSGWTSPRTIAISALNRVPDTPAAPAGPISGGAGVVYSYTATVTDPDGNTVKCVFDWGDGTNTTTTLQTSGTEQSAAHSWAVSGSYNVRAMGIDSKGASSAYSSALVVSISPSDTPVSSIVGTVEDGGTTPHNSLAGATVRLFQGGSEVRNTATGVSGDFTFTGLTSGDYELTAEYPGYTASVPLSLSLAQWENRTGIEILLYKVIVGKGTVNVVVKDTLGKPIANADVRLNLSVGTQAQKTTDDSGAAVFPNLSPGKCDIVVSIAGYGVFKKSQAPIIANETTNINAVLVKIPDDSGGGSNNTTDDSLLSKLTSNSFYMILLIIILIVIIASVAGLMSRRSKRAQEEPVFYPYRSTHSLQQHLAHGNYNQYGAYQAANYNTQTAGTAPRPMQQNMPPPPQQYQQQNQRGPSVKFCKKCGMANENPGNSCTRCGGSL